MKWKSTKIIPSLHKEDGYRESKRLLVWVSDAESGKGAVAFGRCIVHGSDSSRVYWQAEGYSRGFTVSHWRDLPDPPKR